MTGAIILGRRTAMLEVARDRCAWTCRSGCRPAGIRPRHAAGCAPSTPQGFRRHPTDGRGGANAVPAAGFPLRVVASAQPSRTPRERPQIGGGAARRRMPPTATTPPPSAAVQWHWGTDGAFSATRCSLSSSMTRWCLRGHVPVARARPMTEGARTPCGRQRQHCTLDCGAALAGGLDPQPPGNPPINDGRGTGPGNPGNRGGGFRFAG